MRKTQVPRKKDMTLDNSVQREVYVTIQACIKNLK